MTIEEHTKIVIEVLQRLQADPSVRVSFTDLIERLQKESE